MPICKYAFFESPEAEMILKSSQTPPLNEGEILVKINFTTLCRSDIYTYTGIRAEQVPTILGHEVIGTVEELRIEAPHLDIRGNKINVGSRITWAIYSSDPGSEYALKGIPQKAESLFKYGHEKITATSNFHGGLSEYIILRKNTPILVIDNDIPLPVAALLNCSVATVAGAIRLAGDLKDQCVLINGAGMLGLVACAMAKTLGAKRIIAIDSSIRRGEHAKLFGAHYCIGGPVQDDLFDALAKIQDPPASKINVILEFSGIPEAILRTLKCLDLGGTAIWVGATFPQPDISINAETIVRKLLTIRGLHNYNQADLITAVEFMEKHHRDFHFETLIEATFYLDDVQAAFQYAVQHHPYRVGVTTD